MRIRNLKEKDEILSKSFYVLDNRKAYKGKWRDIFKNNNPVWIEIGTGKCKFIYEMAKKYKDVNFVGIEKVDTVLALGIKEINDLDKLDNLRLINYDANNIDLLFNKEVEQLFLNFSDPWPKTRHEKRRLTSLGFLKKYDIIFCGDKIINFKTDNRELFEYSIMSLTNYGYKLVDISLDLHKREDVYNVITEYEKKFSSKGFNIYYLKAIKTL